MKLNTTEWRADFVFEEHARATTSDRKGPQLEVACPVCGGVMRDQGRVFACDKGDFKLWKEVAGRSLSTKEASLLITDKAHPPLDGFTSSKGNKFSAGLRLKPDGKVEFLFEKG